MLSRKGCRFMLSALENRAISDPSPPHSGLGARPTALSKCCLCPSHGTRFADAALLLLQRHTSTQLSSAQVPI